MTERVELKVARIVGALPGPRLLITGGVHGDEFEPMVTIRRLRSAVKPGSLRGTLTLCPVVNEPGYERRHRTAQDNLDLARTMPGRPDGSITQRIAHALAQLIHQADYYIDLHTGGTGLSVYPLAGYKLHADAKVLDAQRRMARAFNLPIVWGTDPTLQGRSLSVARDANIPAIYAEYEGAATCSPRGVEAYVDGCLNVMAELDMIDRPPPTSRVAHLIEDDRPNAGHLQLHNPSPCAGYFEPAVVLGQRVTTSDLLGTVCDPLGDHVEPIHARQNGLVLVLRTFPRVDKDDCLAVILEMDHDSKGKR